VKFKVGDKVTFVIGVYVMEPKEGVVEMVEAKGDVFNQDVVAIEGVDIWLPARNVKLIERKK
jgi:hypothetical protein